MTIKIDWLRFTITASLIATIVFTRTASSAAPIFAGSEVVGFESVSFTYTPSPFKVRQAKKLGIPVEVKTEPSVSLTGYLARPAGEEPRPAIVLLHPCFGISRAEEMWSDRLVSWGYVVLSARHHFSFGHYHDPVRMGLGTLRVWNDDTVAPGTGCLRREAIPVDSFIR